MKAKLKIALAIMLAVTAIMLVTSYAFIPRMAQDLGDKMQNTESETDDSSALGQAIGAAIGVAVVAVIALLLGVAWLLTALMLLIFIPVVLSANTEQKMYKRVKALLICICIFGALTFVTMGICWSFAIYSIPMMMVMTIADLCLTGTIATVIVSDVKLRNYCNELPTNQAVAE